MKPERPKAKHLAATAVVVLLPETVSAVDGEPLQPAHNWRGIDAQGVFPAGDLVASFSREADGTGEMLWQRPADHLDAWPEAKRKQAKGVRRRGNAVADPAIADRLVKRADREGRPEAIREISVDMEERPTWIRGQAREKGW